MNSFWQGHNENEGRAATVLAEVFILLKPHELSNCARVCRVWRRAADEPWLWRRLLTKRGAKNSWLSALSAHPEWNKSWKEEFINTTLEWSIMYKRKGIYVHGSVSNDGNSLAVLDDYECLYIYKGPQWKCSFFYNFNKKIECRKLIKTEWSPDDSKILLVAELFQNDNIQLVIVDVADVHRIDHSEKVHDDIEEKPAKILCKASCGQGTGCWVNNYSFLSLETKNLAPKISVISVWTNSALPETTDEHAGLVSPMFTIYNEALANIKYPLVVNVPEESWNNVITDCNVEDLYCDIMLQKCKERNKEVNGRGGKRLMLVGACGVREGKENMTRALCAWPLGDTKPSDIVVECSLAERRRRRIEQREQDPAPAELPKEHEVRQSCQAPMTICDFDCHITCLIAHHSGRCVWAILKDRYETKIVCVLLPSLTILRSFTAESGPMDSHHNSHLTVSDSFVFSLHWNNSLAWSLASGVRCFCPEVHPLSVALLHHNSQCMLVLTRLKLMVWSYASRLQQHNRAT